MTEFAPVEAPDRFDIAVVGTGPTGLAAALALASGGARTALVGWRGPSGKDLRTAALFPAGVRFLERLGAWQACREKVAPLRAIRLLDDTSWFLRAPETEFTAAELGETALAWNVANTDLVAALSGAADRSPSLTRFTVGGAPSFARSEGAVIVQLADERAISARLVVAADGRDSPLRAFAGITARTRPLDQTAIVATFTHSRPHGDVSTEIHRDAGPLTIVPLVGNRSSLVWVERPREVARLTRLGDAEFMAILQNRLHGLLGSLSELGPRMSFPLQWLDVDRFVGDRIALVGEAAHVLPPIGAQGLNLGLRDVAELAETLLPHLAASEDPGDPSTLKVYDRARRRDALARSFTVDLLNRSLESGALPLQLARGLGLFALAISPTLKRAVMRHGAGGLGLPTGEWGRPEVLVPSRNAGRG